MTTEIQIDGEQFLINGELTYKGRSHQGRRIEGLLFNSRMVQAIFDDDNPSTVDRWRYPDTGVWDPDRNTDEFCAMLPEYRRYGLLGVTVGLQGGGAIYVPEVYDHYINSAFDPDGALKPAYCDRLLRVLKAADAAGMVVIVNYFYWKQVAKMHGEPAVVRATRDRLPQQPRLRLQRVQRRRQDHPIRTHPRADRGRPGRHAGRSPPAGERQQPPAGTAATGAVGGDRRLLPASRQRLLGAQAPPEAAADQGHAGLPGRPPPPPHQRGFDVHQ